MSELAVVIVTYNCAEWIGRCLAAVPAALGGLQAEIVVVDNDSADSSADEVAAHHPEVTLVRSGSNLGFAAAVNLGAAATTADWILLLNPDTDPKAGSLRALYDFARSTPGRGIYGGRTLRLDGAVEPSSCWNLPTLWSTACFALGLATLFPKSKIFDPEAIGGWLRDSVRQVGMVTGCLLLVPRPVWDELGGLDESYFVYGEDADFAKRATAAGYRPTITPAAEVVHAIGVSSEDGGTKTCLLLAGKITYAQKHSTGLSQLLFLNLIRGGVAARALGSRFTGRGKKWRYAWDHRPQWSAGFPPRTN
ncbi:MAG: hypothetical protein JWN95_2579 [Frankiales bacterium]|nr:hypothetical protein [Frankiales bacterium]